MMLGTSYPPTRCAALQRSADIGPAFERGKAAAELSLLAVGNKAGYREEKVRDLVGGGERLLVTTVLDCLQVVRQRLIVRWAWHDEVEIRSWDWREQLVDARRCSGRTQGNVAAGARVQSAELCRYERGERTPQWATWWRLVDALGGVAFVVTPERDR